MDWSVLFLLFASLLCLSFKSLLVLGLIPFGTNVVAIFLDEVSGLFL